MQYNMNEGLLSALAPNLNITTYSLLYVLFILISMAAAYLLGSINTSIVVSRLLYKDDIRRHGSGNAGLTNTLRTYGGKAALLTLFGDIFKTVFSIFLAGLLLGFGYMGGIALADAPYIAGLFAMLGHIFPVYYKFKGGKGVLVAATMVLTTTPVLFPVLFLFFVLVLLVSHYVSLSSVTAAVLYPMTVYSYMKVFFPGVQIPGILSIATIIVALIIFLCHLENLKRIGERTERVFSFKHKPEYTGDKQNKKNESNEKDTKA